MQQGRRWIATAIVCGFGLILAQSTSAKRLNDVIPSLYGGDGITLDNSFHRAHFPSDELTQDLNDLNSEISSALNLVTPGAAVASFTFDLEEAVFVQTTESLGPTVAERPQTIGKGKINFGATYTRLDFKRFDGDKLNNLEFTLDHDPCTPQSNCIDQPGPIDGDPSYELDKVLVKLDIKLTQDIFQFFANYGVLDDWDIGIIVPVVHAKIDVNSYGTVELNHPASDDTFGPPHFFCGEGTAGEECVQGSDVANQYDSETATGFGDVVLRSKYHVLKSDKWLPDVGVFGFVSFPTGDSDDFLGTGHTEFDLFATMAKTFWRLTPHANVGVELSTGGSELDGFRYIAGVEAAIHKRLSVSGDVVGWTAFDRDNFGDDLVDFAVGTKINPFSTIALVGTVIFPLNKNHGLRTNVTWSAGVEYTF